MAKLFPEYERMLEDYADEEDMCNQLGLNYDDIYDYSDDFRRDYPLDDEDDIQENDSTFDERDNTIHDLLKRLDEEERKEQIERELEEIEREDSGILKNNDSVR